MKNTYIVVFVTTKDRKQAMKIADGLLREKLIACANIAGGVTSLFWWQGKVERSKEVFLILKTKKSLFKKMEIKIRSLHSYTTPEIIALPVIMGGKAYLEWINSSLK